VAPLPPVKGFIENSLLDWEGRLAAVLFLPGCNFRCPFCHGSHLLGDAKQLESIPIPKIMEALVSRKGWIDGVVISGGEPTLHPALSDLIQTFLNAGFAVKLDTNGSRPDVLKDLISKRMVEHVAMDIKAPLDERYSRTAGAEVNLNDIRASIEILIGSGVSHEFRTTVCPPFHTDDDILGAALAIRGASHYYLQNFRPINTLDPSLAEVKPYTGEEMRRLAALAAPFVRHCAVRGDPGSAITRKA